MINNLVGMALGRSEKVVEKLLMEIDHYVSVGRNRIDDYAPADQPKDMDVNYAHKFDYDNDLDVRAAEVDVRFTQSVGPCFLAYLSQQLRY